VCVAVTESFEHHLSERLDWLETALHSLNVNDSEIRDMSQKILGITNQRLNDMYMAVTDRETMGPMLRRVAALSRRCAEMQNSINY
jgi:hypothetical protein